VTKLVLVASLLLGSLLMSPGTAHAADYWTCGHRIITTYDQGWIRIVAMTGIAGRTDIWAVGTVSNGAGGYDYGVGRVQAAINERVLFASFNQAQIIIVGHPECTVYIQ
jgi:hypothetical protein